MRYTDPQPRLAPHSAPLCHSSRPCAWLPRAKIHACSRGAAMKKLHAGRQGPQRHRHDPDSEEEAPEQQPSQPRKRKPGSRDAPQLVPGRQADSEPSGSSSGSEPEEGGGSPSGDSSGSSSGEDSDHEPQVRVLCQALLRRPLPMPAAPVTCDTWRGCSSRPLPPAWLCRAATSRSASWWRCGRTVAQAQRP